MNIRLNKHILVFTALALGSLRTIAATDGGSVWTSGEAKLSNERMAASFQTDGKTLRMKTIEDRVNHRQIEWPSSELFTLFIGKPGSPPRVLNSSEMKLSSAPRRISVKGDPASVRGSGLLDGEALEAVFSGEGVRVQWRAILRKGGVVLRQELALAIEGHTPVSIQKIEMFDVQLAGLTLQGYTDGAPLATDHLFFGIEHPMSKVQLNREYDRTVAWTPAEMSARRIEIPLNDVPAGEVAATLCYQRGRHRIEASAMRIRDAQGNERGADVHHGFSGIEQSAKMYTVTLKEPMASGVCVIELSHPTNENDSWGEIQVSTGPSRNRAEASWPRHFDLTPGTVWQVSSAIGVYAPGQLRRTFTAYIEQERAHPYRQYWHYNSWYDLNIDCNDNPDPLKRMVEAQCLEAVAAFGRELKDKRGVGLDGFVWDDGWDDWNSLWQFHQGFPNGFSRIDEEARKQGAGIGAWLSPWGGYGGSKAKRVEYGRQKGFETNPTGFSMGGPRYYANFRDVCLRMIRNYAQNYFKFDGIGGGTYATGANESIAPDLDGLMRLIAELRVARPSIFINCTVGTWASPYWLWSADSVWRQGSDVDFKGVGNAREQWITYRDHEIYARFASRSPLYPISSLMYHGVVMGDRGLPNRMPRPDRASTDEQKAESLNSFRHEVWMAAGLGSTLGELYVSPRVMTPEYWDVLADAVKWSRAHAAIMPDNHWIGGSPERLEVYGYAGWTPKGGVITLRNPSDKPQSFALEIGSAFELPSDAGRKYRLSPVWKTSPTISTLAVEAGTPITIELAPFEVVVFEAMPVSR